MTTIDWKSFISYGSPAQYNAEILCPTEALGAMDFFQLSTATERPEVMHLDRWFLAPRRLAVI